MAHQYHDDITLYVGIHQPECHVLHSSLSPTITSMHPLSQHKSPFLRLCLQPYHSSLLLTFFNKPPSTPPSHPSYPTFPCPSKRQVIPRGVRCHAGVYWHTAPLPPPPLPLPPPRTPLTLLKCGSLKGACHAMQVWYWHTATQWQASLQTTHSNKGWATLDASMAAWWLSRLLV